MEYVRDEVGCSVINGSINYTTSLESTRLWMIGCMKGDEGRVKVWVKPGPTNAHFYHS